MPASCPSSHCRPRHVTVSPRLSLSVVLLLSQLPVLIPASLPAQQQAPHAWPAKAGTHTSTVSADSSERASCPSTESAQPRPRIRELTEWVTGDAIGLAALAGLRRPVTVRLAGDDAATASSRLVQIIQRWDWDYIARGLPHVYATASADGLMTYSDRSALLSALPGQAEFRAQPPFLLPGLSLRNRLSGCINVSSSSSGDPASIGVGPARASTVLVSARDGRFTQANGELGRDLKPVIDDIMRAVTPKTMSHAVQGNLWMSSGGSTTLAHFDASHNLFVQLIGRKRVYLLPPNATQLLPLHPCLSSGHRSLRDGTWLHETLHCDHCKVANSLSKLACEGAIATTLFPGEALYIPPFWLHHIVTLDEVPSASLSIWSTSVSDVADVLHRSGDDQAAAAIWPSSVISPEWDAGERLAAALYLLRECTGVRYPAVLQQVFARYRGLVPLLELPEVAKRGFCGIGHGDRAIAHLWPEGTDHLSQIAKQALAVVRHAPTTDIVFRATMAPAYTQCS